MGWKPNDLGKPAGLSGAPSGEGGHKDLSSALTRYWKRAAEWDAELRALMWALVEERERISRIWACFLAMDYPYYEILSRLYVRGELYEDAAKEMRMSTTTFERARRRAVDRLIAIYQGGEPAAEMMRPRAGRAKKSRGGQRDPGADQPWAAWGGA